MRRLLANISPTSLLQTLSASPAAASTPRVHPEVEAWAIRAAASNGFGGDLVYTSAGRKRTDAAPHAASVDLSDPLASAVVRARLENAHASSVMVAPIAKPQRPVMSKLVKACLMSV